MRRYPPLLMILALLGALGLVQVATAAAAQPTATTSTSFSPSSSVLLAAAPEAEEEDEGEEAEGGVEEAEFEVEEEVLLEECESATDEFEFEDAAEEKEFEEEVAECETEAKKKAKSSGASFVSAPEECVVERAESTIQTLPGSDSVRLTVHYKDYSTGAVAIGLKLKDHKGSLALEHTTRHLGLNGTLRLTTKLGESEMERAEDAREFDVALRAPGTPGYCGDMLEQHLKTTAPPAAHGSSAHGTSRVFRTPAKKG
ncbi:MAG: hypothetical protein JWO14_1621 [Solirubrobacterales bacterium]|nr:hypothetical protein [Solirubrobacterales bacterium]